jgi:diguanylate cyclase (GGDEF)-like protein
VRAAVRLLLVEDSVAQARFFMQTLQEPSTAHPFDVTWAKTLTEALEQLAEAPPDLVLLDLTLPDSDGIGTFAAVRDARPELPVIVLSGASDETTALRAVTEGAQDYLPKSSVSPALLTRSIRYALERDRNLVELRRLALRDDLTGALNRRGFLLLAEQELAVARRTSNLITVLFVDVDGLKRVNDTYGHQAGDRALADVAALMRATFRASDVIGRIGGDEFCALLLDDGVQPADGPTTVARFQAAIDAHNAGGTHPAPLSCTVGVVTRKATSDLSITDLLAEADDDLYDNRRRRPLDGLHAADGLSATFPSEGELA